MTIITLFRESLQLVTGALIFRSVLAAGAHLRAEHRFFPPAVSGYRLPSSHFRAMPLNRWKTGRLEKEAEELRNNFLRKIEKKAKVKNGPVAWRGQNG
jgi:hypothetical protein